MLYERFFKWLTFYKRRHCDHEWEKVGESSKFLGSYSYTLIYYDHFECTNCGKREKRQNPKKGGGTYMMI